MKDSTYSKSSRLSKQERKKLKEFRTNRQTKFDNKWDDIDDEK